MTPVRGPHSSWLALIGSVVLTLVLVVAGGRPAWAQLGSPIGVDSLITSPVPATPLNFPTAPYTTPCDPGTFAGCSTPGATTNLTFGTGANLQLLAVEVAGNRYEPASDLLPPDGLPEQVIFRRNGTPARELLFFQHDGAPTPTTLNLLPDAAAGIEEAMLSRFINRGIDNVFNNVPEIGPGGTGQETANNIQRVDYVVTGSGIQVPVAQQGDVGFLILERGGNDAFGIAAITAIDAATRTPTAYGPLVSVPAATWGASPDVTVASAVLRRDNLALPTFGPSHLVGPQNIQGIFVPINSLLPPGPGGAIQPIFGYSLFATDVTAGANLVDFTTFPTTTTGANAVGGLDLVAGGFGLIRRVQAQPANFALVKRITNLIGPTNLPDFTQVLGNSDAENQLRAAGLGQGVITVDEPTVEADDAVEYTVYLSNTGGGDTTGVIVCDQIPGSTLFAPDSFGDGLGIQAIAPSNPPGPVENYTNADDGDPGTYFPPGATLPAVCGTDQGNGAVVVNVGTVGADQVGFIRFQATVR